MLLAGAKVPYQEKGKTKYYVLKLIDFDHPQKNEFLAIRQFWVKHHELKKLDHVIFIRTGLVLSGILPVVENH